MNRSTKSISFESSSKLCFRQKSLSKGLRWAHYQNEQERLLYINDKQHTLSMYLAGGHQTHRTDITSKYGAPGRFCLMPQNSESCWQLGAPQQFIHLYFDDNHLKQLALKVFDVDPRLIELPQLTFIENQALEAMFRHHIAVSDWSASDGQLMLEQVTDTILVSMLQSLKLTKPLRVIKGGLAPNVVREVCDFMQTNFQRQIYLHELARIAQLSEYHFCRMFKENLAQTPQQYLMSVRIERVKQLVTNSELTLVDIALQCGFSNQSHMGRYFKKLVGCSPRDFRRRSYPLM